MLSPAEEDEILRLAQLRLGLSAFFPDLESLLTSDEGFGLPATPLQRAVCRLVDGRPLAELATPLVSAALGNLPLEPFNVARQPPPEVVLLAGVRTAKSMIAAAVAIMASQRCDVSQLSPGEIPRFSILSLSLDNAKVTMGHLVGVLQKPRLKHLRVDPKQTENWRELMEESSAESAWSVFVWHPSGRPIEIRVIAGKRAGGSLVSRWSAGCCLDEAARMVGESDGVINYEDAVKAVRTRLLPGAQIISISSPWQPYGPIYDLVQVEWGVFNANRVILKARGPWMNPVWWNDARCAEIKESNPVAYQTDVLAEFADLSESLYPAALLAQCTALGAQRPAPPPGAKVEYVAAMDPATRGNSWALVILSRQGNVKYLEHTVQWTGSTQNPLSPRAVLLEIRDILNSYGINWCYTDQWSSDALRDIGFDIGLDLMIEEWTDAKRTMSFLNMAREMADGRVGLVNDPILLKDLRLTKKVPTAKGISIRLASTPDGRHCDFAPALALAMAHYLRDVEPAPVKRTLDEQILLQEEEEVRRMASKNGAAWWNQDPFGGG